MAEAQDGGPHSEILYKNLVHLKDNLNFRTTSLFDRLVGLKLFTKREKQIIQSKTVPFEKAGELLDIVLNKRDDASQKFLAALHITHQKIYNKIWCESPQKGANCDMLGGK